MEIFDWLGHDGSEIVWPQFESPHRHRSFHVQELVEYALVVHRIRVVYLERLMRGTPDGTLIQELDSKIIDSEICGQRGVLLTYDGLRSHAVAWDGEHVFDGLIRKSLNSPIHAFCLI